MSPYKLSKRSADLLAQAHPAWAKIIPVALQFIDLQIMETRRGKDRQNALKAEGKSKLSYPDGRHNRTLDPSLKERALDYSDAVDLVVYPFGYTERGPKQIVFAAGIIVATAKSLGYTVRWGGDWNMDGEMNNRRGDFYDAWHFELVW